jgi:hypothetical protein
MILRAIGQAPRADDPEEPSRTPRLWIVLEALVVVVFAMVISDIVPGISDALALGGALTSSFTVLIGPGLVGLVVTEDLEDQRKWEEEGRGLGGTSHVTKKNGDGDLDSPLVGGQDSSHHTRRSTHSFLLARLGSGSRSARRFAADLDAELEAEYGEGDDGFARDDDGGEHVVADATAAGSGGVSALPPAAAVRSSSALRMSAPVVRNLAGRLAQVLGVVPSDVTTRELLQVPWCGGGAPRQVPIVFLRRASYVFICLGSVTMIGGLVVTFMYW